MAQKYQLGLGIRRAVFEPDLSLMQPDTAISPISRKRKIKREHVESEQAINEKERNK
jgi:hypothetical protein